MAASPARKNITAQTASGSHPTPPTVVAIAAKTKGRTRIPPRRSAVYPPRGRMKLPSRPPSAVIDPAVTRSKPY
jgi:hypothetical protein